MTQFRSLVRPAAVIVLGLITGWLVIAVTIDRVFARSMPDLALAWNPGSADANVNLADALLQKSTGDSASANIADRAMRSLRRQPVNPGAARLLGIIALTHGDLPRSEALARYAEAMSRRDLPTQLWLIEASVARGDVATALLHYDRAMKTSEQGRTLLFPTLNAAATDPAIWRPLSMMLARRPQWWRPFVEQFVPRSDAPDALYAIARRTGIDRPPTADPALLRMIEDRLVNLGAYTAAADLYARAHGTSRANLARLRDGGFEETGGGDPFDWVLRDEADLAAVRQPAPAGRGGSALFLTAANGRSGDLATQLVLLHPGRHIVQATTGGVAGDPIAYPRIVVRCAGSGGREIATARFPAAPDAGVTWRNTFVVPADCPAQYVAVQINSALDPSASMPWIDGITITPEKN